MGYARFEEGPDRIGYLINMLQCTLIGEDRLERSGLDMYFLQQDGDTFKATLAFQPYLYLVMASTEFEKEIRAALERKFEGLLSSLELVELEDLEMHNHLAGHKRRLLKLSFRSSSEMMTVRQQLRPIVEVNAAKQAKGESLEVSVRLRCFRNAVDTSPPCSLPPFTR